MDNYRFMELAAKEGGFEKKSPHSRDFSHEIGDRKS